MTYFHKELQSDEWAVQANLGPFFGVAASLTGLQHLNPLGLSPTITLSLSVLNRFSRFSFFVM